MNIKQLDQLIKHIEHNKRGIGNISIFHDEKQVYSTSFGQSQLLIEDSNNKYFHIGSITKAFTAVLIVNLVQQNKLSISDPLSLFFSNIKNAENITIEHLLNHSSGIPDYIVNNNETWLTSKQKKENILKFIENSKPLFEPGEQQIYSNSGYYLLKEIIESIYKDRYYKALQDVILSKINTSEIYSDQQSPEFVHQSYEYANGWKKIVDFDFSNVVGVGDLACTPTELNIFVIALFRGRIIDKKWVEYMKPLPTELIFGRGLMKITSGNITFMGYCGDTYGTHSVMLYNDELNISIAFSLNGATYSPLVFFDQVVSSLFDEDFKLPVFRSRLLNTASELEKYTGKYISSNFPIQFIFCEKDNTLYAQGTGQPVYALTCYEPNIFEYELGKMIFRFNIKENEIIFFYEKGEVIFKKELQTIYQ